jgi:hypothetical protein
MRKPHTALFRAFLAVLSVVAPSAANLCGTSPLPRYLSRASLPAPPRTAPPESLPESLLWAFTRCGSIPVSSFYVDDTRGGAGTRYAHSLADIEARIAAATRELRAPPPPLPPRGAGAAARGSRASWAHLLAAARLPAVAAALRGGSVAVFGSSSPAVEALALAGGAARVVTVEYNALEYAHPLLSTATPAGVAAAWAAGNATLLPPPRAFSLALSVSSFDHDGLGRYGDPLAPDGDFAAMDGMAAYLAPGALALVSVPVGPDRVFMNLMRRYGRVRLPLLLEGWEVLERVGWHEAMLDAAADGAGGSPGPSYEPVFVLRWRGDAAREL